LERSSVSFLALHCKQLNCTVGLRAMWRLHHKRLARVAGRRLHATFNVKGALLQDRLLRKLAPGPVKTCSIL
jgi:hypothetical protein